MEVLHQDSYDLPYDGFSYALVKDGEATFHRFTKKIGGETFDVALPTFFEGVKGGVYVTSGHPRAKASEIARKIFKRTAAK